MHAAEHWQRLLELLELEHQEETERFCKAKAERSPKERVRLGRRVDDARCDETRVGLGGHVLVAFVRASNASWPKAFEPGAAVEVTPKRQDAADQDTLPAVVWRRGAGRLLLAFSEWPPDFVTLGEVAVEARPNDITFRRARDAVERFLGKDSELVRCFGPLLAGEKQPSRFRPTPIDDAARLNAGQQRAVSHALATPDIGLIHGPPGTGKSTVLIELVQRSAVSGERVLATAGSNAAVDHLLALCAARGLTVVRIGHPARVSEELQQHTLDVVVEQHPDRKLAKELWQEAAELLSYARKQRQQGRSRERFRNANEAKRRARALQKEARQLERRAVRQVLGEAQVVCVTCSSIGVGELAGEVFDLAVVDEATQIIEPLSLWPFLRGKRVVMAGDHKQLPPTVLSQQAAAAGLGVSLFERLFSVLSEASTWMLTRQYRMSKAIMEYPSRTMYDSRLDADATVANQTLAGLYPALDKQDQTPWFAPVVFIDTAGTGYQEELEKDTESFFNPEEAALVVAHVRRLLELGVASHAIGVIAPYAAQVTHLRALFSDTKDIEVHTVDAFQGREKEVIAVSFTRSNDAGDIGFLRELRRTNVAITRARRHLLLVGDSGTLGVHDYYQGLIDYCEDLGAYHSAWSLMA